MTLTEFLLARIAEDEAEAEARDRRDWYDGGWDPDLCAKIARECEAKRAIVSMVDGALAMSADLFAPFRLVLHSLALPYADHPDYREEWKP